jgi:osmotically-inducible protein OsmY
LGNEIQYITVKAERGTVILRGAVSADANKKNCQRAAASVEGVKKVDNQLFVSVAYKYGL